MLKDFFKRQLNKKDTEKTMVLKQYHHMNAKAALAMFYGKEDNAVDIIKQLDAVFCPYNSSLSDNIVKDSFELYMQVWIRSRGGFDPSFSTPPYIKNALINKFRHLRPEAVENAVDICFNFIYAHEPDLADRNIKIHKNKVNFNDGSGEYRMCFFQGSNCFENRNYQEAIKWFKHALEYKNDDTAVRFEIAEAYIALKDYNSAKETLSASIPFIKTQQDKARFYRRLGFMEIENGNIPLAGALLVYSLEFEKSPRAYEELEYIKRTAGYENRSSRDEIIQLLDDHKVLFWNS